VSSADSGGHFKLIFATVGLRALGLLKIGQILSEIAAACPRRFSTRARPSPACVSSDTDSKRFPAGMVERQNLFALLDA
jgi:hypothetical protein